MGAFLVACIGPPNPAFAMKGNAGQLSLFFCDRQALAWRVVSPSTSRVSHLIASSSKLPALDAELPTRDFQLLVSSSPELSMPISLAFPRWEVGTGVTLTSKSPSNAKLRVYIETLLLSSSALRSGSSHVICEGMCNLDFRTSSSLD